MKRFVYIMALPMILLAMLGLKIVLLATKLVGSLASAVFGISGGIMIITAVFCYGFALEPTAEVVRMIACGLLVMILPGMLGLAEGAALILLQCTKNMIR